VDVQGKSLLIQATSSKNDTHHDTFQFDVNLAEQHPDILHANFLYQPKANTTIQFSVQLKSIIEFNTTNTAYYKGDEKTIISQWPMNGTGVQWQDWVDESSDISGVHVYSYSATSVDGVFTIRVYITETDLNVNRFLALDPDNVKMDFEIHNYPYQNNVNNSRLAIHSYTVSQTNSSVSGPTAASNRILAFGETGTPMGVFTWDGQVNTTTEMVNVNAWGTNTTGNAFNIYFTFGTTIPLHPRDLIWDPRVGVYYGSIEFCMGGICGGIAFVVIAAVVVGAVILVSLVTVLVMKKRESSRNRGSYDIIQ
jgi:hypothetical protein